MASIKRNEKYDFYRGLLILGVIWGHTITALKCGGSDPSLLARFFRTYDMPMFAFISGYFLNKSIQKHTFSNNILSKAGMILFPIILWNIIFKAITLDTSLSISRFWFLWAIFIASVIILITEKIFGFSKIVKGIVYIVTAICIHTVVNLPFNAAFLFVPCVFGMYYDACKEKVTGIMKNGNTRYIKLALIAIFAVMLIFWDVEYNVWNTGNNIFAFSTPLITSLRIVYRTTIGIIGTLSMKFIFDFLNIYTMPKIKTALCAAGRNTLEIYILQSYLVEILGTRAVAFVVNRLGFNVFTVNTILRDFVFAFTISVVSVVVCYYIQKWLKHIPKIGTHIFGIGLGRKKVLPRGE